jgi:hypothetical protein
LRAIFQNRAGPIGATVAKRKSATVDIETNLPNDDFSKLTEDQTLDLLELTFTALCQRLEQGGVDPELITGTLFGIFADRMAELGDRESFDCMLAEAIETPWQDYTLH